MAFTGVPHKYHIFYVQLAPIGGILGPLKSVLAPFWPFWANKAHFMKYRQTHRSFLAVIGRFLKLHFQIPHNKCSNLAETELLIFLSRKNRLYDPRVDKYFIDQLINSAFITSALFIRVPWALERGWTAWNLYFFEANLVWLRLPQYEKMVMPEESAAWLRFSGSRWICVQVGRGKTPLKPEDFLFVIFGLHFMFIDSVCHTQRTKISKKTRFFHERRKVLSRPMLVYENNHQAGKVTRQKDQRGVEVC